MSNWVQKDAAELLNISPRVMNYKIKTLAIEYPRGRRIVEVARDAASLVVDGVADGLADVVRPLADGQAFGCALRYVSINCAALTCV
jgi:hypothetical protein